MSTTWNIINVLSRQQLFDFVVKSVLAQGKPSYNITANGDILCQYRCEDGRRCAAGHVIADSEYSADFEGQSIEHVLEKIYGPECHVHAEKMRLLADLQEVHDWAIGVDDDRNFPKEFLWRARALAENTGLSVVELNAFVRSQT